MKTTIFQSFFELGSGISLAVLLCLVIPSLIIIRKLFKK